MNSISWRNNFIDLEEHYETLEEENKRLKLQYEALEETERQLRKYIEAHENLYPQLLPDFLEAMNEIGAYGFNKHGGKKVIDLENRLQHSTPARVLPESNIAHARDHALDYLRHIPHDHFGDYKYQLAAGAFNLMMEYHFARLEGLGK